MIIFESYIRLVENTLTQQSFDTEPLGLYEPISYLLNLGGKRLRPALCLAACDFVGGSVDSALMPAIGIEVFHNFTLMHDDIMDGADLRRNSATVHKKWNLNTAILSGDAMLVKAYQYIGHTDPKHLGKVLATFSQVAIEVCEGQQYDLEFEERNLVEEDEYIDMIRLKTSVLLGAALKIGAILGGANEDTADRLYQFGVNIGIAFQIQDDLLDAFGDPEQTGKVAGGDILNHKQTLLMIQARNTDSRRIEQSLKIEDEVLKVSSVLRLFEETGSRKYAEERRDHYYEMAIRNLNEVEGDTEIKKGLADFAEWLIRRNK